MPARSSRRLARPDAERRVRQTARLSRVLRLLDLLRGQARRTARELAAELECAERTVYRDLNVLEMAGVPWYFDAAMRSYRLRPGWQFPIVNLTREELLGQATATVLARAPGLAVGPGAAPTTKRLRAQLTAEQQQVLRDAEQLLTVLDLKLVDNARSHAALRTIQSALLERRQLSGHYQGPYHERPGKLLLHPYRLCLAQHAWYLIARPANQAEPKTYRAARFRSLRALDAVADVPAEFDLRAYFGNAWGVFQGAPTHDIELHFSREAAVQVTETQWHATQKVRWHRDRSVTLTFRVDGLDEIVWWLLGWAGFVRVVRPDELRARFVEQLRAGIARNA